jgi:osmoprotectant transport system permease protein
MTQAILEHILLVAVSVALSLAAGLPLGVIAQRRKSVGSWIVRGIDIVQTIPSLALFGLLLPLPFIGGIGPRIAIVALFLYALLPIVRNTIAGLDSVPEDVREAALALGMQPIEILREVELPLAFPAILAGVRIATVTAIGTATVAAAIGAGGLGVLLYRGLATVETSLLLQGALPAAVMAMVADRGFVWIEDRLSPWR